MNKDLYVRNIALEAKEEDLRKLFSVVGKVSYIHMVTDPKTGQFKGYGYVKMSTEAEAREAVKSLDGARLINRIISVTEARPQNPAEHKSQRSEGKSARKRGPTAKRR